MASSAVATASDESLLVWIAAGDQHALSELYARYSAIVFSFIMVRTTDRGVAEEVSADVWLGCWRSARAFRQDSQVLTWLLGIAKRQIHMHTRRKQLPQVPLENSAHALPVEDDDPAELVVSADEAQTLVAALNALPAELVEVVRLAWVYELPYEEIAHVAGIPPGTVKSRVFRARRLLREELRRNHAQ